VDPCKKKKKSSHIKILNSWLGSLDLKYSIQKNHEIQFSINQILKDKIEETFLILQKD